MKMSSLNIFLVLLLALCVSEPIHALAPNSSRVELFIRKVSTVPFEENDGTIRERVVNSYRIPSLLDVEGVMVAVGDARYETSNDNSFIETVVKYSVDDGETWKTQIAIKNSRVTSVSRVVDPTVIVKGNKIYVLVGRFNSSTQYWTNHKDGSDWDPLLAVGELTKTTVDGKTSASIKWSKPVSLKSFFPAEIAGSPSKEFLGGSGSAIVASNGDLVFPVQATNKANNIYSMLMLSQDDGQTWKFGEGLSAPGCSEPTILEWEGKIIISNRVDGSQRLVYETADMGKTWTEAIGTLSRVWGNSPQQGQPGSESSFVAVTIEGKRVMLFTHPLNFKGRWLRDRLHLWVTDNQRIFDVGQVSIGDENSAYSSVLYKDDKLYCLHEINTDEVYSLVFARLIGELQLIKSVVKSWKEEDEYLSNICTPVASRVAAAAAGIFTPSSRENCGVPFPTNGLVGFLSHNADDEHWKDLYHCVHANISNAERIPNGLKFTGAGGGAVWPVRKQGQNRRYQFANHAFTLVATVTIDKIPVDSSPVLGVSLDDSGSSKLLGLSHNKDRKWQPIYGSATVSPTGSWEPKREHHVALSMADKKGSVYVDGQLLQESGKVVWNSENLPEISHFYIGGYGVSRNGAESHLTVTNVLLYNRQLAPSEIETLFLSKDLIGKEGRVVDGSDSSDTSDVHVSSDSATFPAPVGGRSLVWLCVCGLISHLLILPFIF